MPALLRAEPYARRARARPGAVNTELPGALLASQELEAGGGGRGFAFGEDPAVMISSVIPPGNGMCMNVAASIALVPDHLTTGDTDV